LKKLTGEFEMMKKLKSLVQDDGKSQTQKSLKDYITVRLVAAPKSKKNYRYDDTKSR